MLRRLTGERLIVVGLLIFTAVLRGGVLWGMRDNLDGDPDAYREIAENILQHGVYGLGKDGPPRPTAYRPPLYPIVLSNLPAADDKHVSLWKVAVLHVLLGVATVWLTWLTAHRLLASGGREPPEADHGTPQRAFPTAPLVAALLVACDPILLNQQTLLMTETLATLLAILSLWCLVRFSGHRYWWNAALAGGTIGLAALCRPTFLPWLGLVAATLLISDFGFRISYWGRWTSRTLPNFVALAVAAVAVVSPWVVRNQREMGKPILTTTHGGYTLYLGNNDSFYDYLEHDKTGLPWNAEIPSWLVDVETSYDVNHDGEETDTEFLITVELMQDAGIQREAKATIQRRLQSFVIACLYRVRQLWSPLPHKLTADESTGRKLLRFATAAWYCGVYLLCAVGVWRLRWRLLRQPWVWGVLLCVAFTAVHTFYWCNLRMRAPLMPFVALVAAAGVAVIRDKANTDRTDGAD